MCSNYEAQLVRAQQSMLVLENKLAFSEQNTDRANENIKREIQLRSEMQAKWEQQKDQYKSQVKYNYYIKFLIFSNSNLSKLPGRRTLQQNCCNGKGIS